MAKSRDQRIVRPQALRAGGKREYGDYSRGEVVSLAAQLYYFDGLTQERISEELSSRGIEFPRQAIADCLREVREQGRLRYIAPVETRLGAYILERNPLVHEAWVVESAVPDHIAGRGADMLLTLLRQHKRDTLSDEIHVGFAGGRTPNLLAQSLAELLADLETRPEEEYTTYPKRIFFHSLIGSVSLGDALVGPNSYFIHFLGTNRRLVWRYFELRFSSLPLPALVLQKEQPRIAEIKTALKKVEMTRDAVDSAKMAQKLHVIVTSCGHWGRGHLSLFDHVSQSCSASPGLKMAWERTVRQLESEGVQGDVAWCPLRRDGPITAETELQIEKLFEIQELSQFAHPAHPATAESPSTRGKILLLAGPCSGCTEPKGHLLRAILGLNPPPLTHLVVDTRTVDEYRLLTEDSK